MVTPISGRELLRRDWLARHGEPDVQFEFVDGVADLTWGHPDPTLLPAQAVAEATDNVLRVDGWKALSYGHAAGPSVLREELISHLASIGERRPHPDELLVTSGNSGTIDLLATLLTKPGDVVFVEEPTYFLALRIFGDHPVEIVGVRSDSDGLVPHDLDAKAQLLRQSGRRASLLYLVPTHNNPSGTNMPLHRRLELLTVAHRHGLVVMEDDVYREVSFDGQAPESLWSLDPEGVVIRMGSFSKTLSPGIRVGYITAAPALIGVVQGSGVLDSGGGLSYFAACIVGELLRSGSYGRSRDAMVKSFAARCTALGDTLVGSPLIINRPTGGFFLWAALPDGMTGVELCDATLKAGVRCTNGTRFFASQPPGEFVRLAFSMLNEAELAAAGRLIADTAAALLR